jgi:membrane associated rhomboid family serine protease
MPQYGIHSTGSRIEDLLGAASSSSSEALYTDQEQLSPLSNEPRRHDRGERRTGMAKADDDTLYDLSSLRQEDNQVGPRSYTIDPFEASYPSGDAEIARLTNNAIEAARAHSNEGRSIADESDYLNTSSTRTRKDGSSFIIGPAEIHPNMESKEEEVQRLRLLAGKISNNWGNADFMAPALARRIRDFQFAQEKRRKKYGDEHPWGILGVYDHLASIRIDVEWAEDAAQRRANGEPYQSWADFDENKKGANNRPYFTYLLLLICSAVMIASIAVNQWSVEPFGENPLLGPSAETLILMGAKESGRIVVEKEGWRLVTSSLLHAGLVHYIVNMLALWFVGAAIETGHGWFSATLIFSLSALGGSILSAIFLPQAISVGASGGIFGTTHLVLLD